MDDVPDDEEVAAETHPADNAKFVFEALEDIGRGVGIPPGKIRPAKLLEIAFRGLALGDGEVREDGFSKCQLQVALFCNPEGVGDSFGDIPEKVGHHLGGFEVEMPGPEAEPVLFIEEGPGLKAEERIVRLPILLVQVMRIVCGDKGNLALGAQLHEQRKDRFLVGKTVVLDLEKEMFLPENLLVFPDRFAGSLEIASEEFVGDFALKAGAHPDQAASVFPEEFLVDPGFVVEAFSVTSGGELHQVLVPLVVPC